VDQRPRRRPKEKQPDLGLPGRSGWVSEELAHQLPRYEAAHQRALLMANYAMATNDHLAKRLYKCGHWLVFRHYYTVGLTKLIGADFCRLHLLCPMCAIRRSARLLRTTMARLSTVIRADPTLQAYMVTLTVKDGGDLSERYHHLRRGIQAMLVARRLYISNPAHRRHVEAVKAVGGLYSVEVKRGAGSGQWHPHVHMVWLCHESPDARRLSDEWLRWTGDSYIVDVRPISGSDKPLSGVVAVSGVVEVCKYAVKFHDLDPADNWHVYQLLHHRRLVGSFGALHGVDLDEEDTAADIPADIPWMDLIYRWFGGLNGHYRYQRTIDHRDEVVKPLPR